MTESSVDIAIIGGGIAGLWTLAAAAEKGYNAILLEKDALGCGQTLSSQGIIHGGSKYALAASLTNATQIITEMPGIWLAAHAGRHSVDISQATLLSTSQYLIPAPGIDARLLSFLGSKTMRSHTRKVKPGELPAPYQACGINQSAFQLNEIVFDTRSLIGCFHEKYADRLFRCQVKPHQINVNKDKTITLSLDQHNSTVHTKYLVLACGEGYAEMQMPNPQMQKRPLHMVIMKGKNLPPIYAHFIGRSTKPLLTITSHPCSNGRDFIWYLGGGLAEDGVGKPYAEQLAEARKLVRKLVPGVTIDDATGFFSYHINRAEQKQVGLVRPDDAFVIRENNIITGWPTKLALAPRFAEKVLNEIQCAAGGIATGNLPSLPMATLAEYPWHPYE